MTKETIPQNSPLRNSLLSSRIIYPIVNLLEDKGVTPDQVSFFGTGLVTLGALFNKIKLPKNSQRYVGNILIALGVSCDVLDGSLARRKPDRNKTLGVIIDNVNDRLQEIFLAGIRIFWNENKFVKLSSQMVLLTSTLPSLLRAINEATGRIVPESGQNPLEFLGTRAGRFFLSMIALNFPKIQPYIDSLITFTNLFTTFSRAKNLAKLPQKNLDPQIRKDALAKIGLLSGLSLLSIGLLILLKKLEKQKDFNG